MQGVFHRQNRHHLNLSKPYPPPSRTFILLTFPHSVCLVALAARADSKATGIFCKFGSEMCILTTSLLIPSEPVACFANAMFFITGSSKAQHAVKVRG